MRNGVPPSKFRLWLLGHFELNGPGGVVDLPSKKLAGLLAYLACTAPQPQPRERLSALLWGSHFDAQAKQNLRQALYRLRKVLGQDARATARSYRSMRRPSYAMSAGSRPWSVRAAVMR